MDRPALRPVVWAALLAVAAPEAATAAAPADDWSITRRPDDEALVGKRLAALHRRPFDRPQLRALVRTLGARKALARLRSKVRKAPQDPAWSIVYARALMRYGDPAEAVTVLASVAGHAERFEPALSLLRAEALDATGATAEALALLSRTARTHPSVAVERARLALARRAGDHRQAVEAARNLARRTPSRENWLVLADAATKAGDAPVVDDAYRRARDAAKGTSRWEIQLAWARARARLGRHAGAAELALEVAQQARPRSLRRAAWTVHVAAWRALGRLDEAERTLARLAEAHPDDPVVAYVLGILRYERGKDGREALAAAYRADPKDPEIRGAYVTALLDAGDLDAAVAVVTRTSPRTPQAVEQHLEVAGRLYDAGRIADAVRLAERLAEVHRRDGATLAALVDFWNVRGEEARALDVARAWAKARPRDERAVVALGEQLHALGKRDEALAVWSRLPKITRPAHAGRARFAELLAEHGHLYRAVAELRAALERAPEVPAYHRAMAIMRERGGQDDAALAHWKLVASLARSPSEATMRNEARTRIVDLLFTGRLRNRSRTLEIEIHRLERLLDAADPVDEAIEAGRLLAEIHTRAGHHEEAVAVRRTVVEIARNAPWAVEELARSLRRAGRPDEALEVLARAPARSDAERAERDRELALLSVDAGRTEEAIERARRADVSRNRPDALLAVGARFEERGDLEAAAAAYAAAAALGFDGARGRLAAARVDLLQGHRARAVAALSAVAEDGAPDDALAAGKALLSTGLVAPSTLFERFLAKGAGSRQAAFDGFLLEVAARLSPAELRSATSTPEAAAAFDAVLRRAIRAGTAADRARAAAYVVALDRKGLAGDLLRAGSSLVPRPEAPQVARRMQDATRFVLLHAAATVGDAEVLDTLAAWAVGMAAPAGPASPVVARSAGWAMAMADTPDAPRRLLVRAAENPRDAVVAPACLAIVRLLEPPPHGAIDLARTGRRQPSRLTDRQTAHLLCPVAEAVAMGADRRWLEALRGPDASRSTWGAFALGVAAEPTDEVLVALLRRVLGPPGPARRASVTALARILEPDRRTPRPPPVTWSAYSRAAGAAAGAAISGTGFLPYGHRAGALRAWLAEVMEGPPARPLSAASIERIEALLPRILEDLAREGTPAERERARRILEAGFVPIPALTRRPFRVGAVD